MDNTVGSLTQSQKSLLIGTLLGDGYVRIVPGRRNAFLEVNHSYHAKAYVEWKYRMLRDIAGSYPVMRKAKQGRIAYRFYTKQHPDITKLHEAFYQKGYKIVPDNLILDPLSLAVWYMDDGSRCRSSDVYLNTQQFEKDDQKHLITILEKLGIESRTNKDKQYLRLRILKSSLPKLRALIERYIIPEMRYKIEI
ncbi:MAG: hypothetical protein G01um101466_157 [Parcubacteria group bacterium Gr01-1014_66]|nr:MAG: hypothetical protein G01um101466_157 [Parcubacteria group bacterium Gr01-1014_66]